MNTTLPEITTRGQFCEFIQEIIWELRHDPSQWYYRDLSTYLEELAIHMAGESFDKMKDENMPFKELAAAFDNARRERDVD